MMLFGLRKAPVTFQKLTEVVLNRMARNECMLVVGRTFEEYNNNLDIVLCQLVLFWNQLEVGYMDHVVSAEGIRAKVKAVLDFPVSTNVKALWSFLGLASCSYVPQIAGPLHILTKKNSEFTWTAVRMSENIWEA